MRHATSKICAATLEQFMSITTSTIYRRNPKALLRVLIKGGCPFCEQSRENYVTDGYASIMHQSIQSFKSPSPTGHPPRI